MKLNPKIALEVAHHEAVIRQAYKDSEGNWTWSVGLTSAAGHNVERYIGKPQSMQYCMDVFIWALRNYADDVNEAFDGFELTEEQFAAALSFHWNTGAIKKASWVKHWKKQTPQGRAAAFKAFMNYRKPTSIIPRRRKERDLFFKGKWCGDGHMREYTRLTKRHTPVWKSRVQVDVSAELKKALNQFEPHPIAVPAKPATKPNPVKPKKKNLISAIITLISKLFGRKKR